MAREFKASYSTLEQKVAERTRELSALYEVTTIVNQSLELDPVLQQVMKRLTEIFSFDAIGILLFDKHREELHVRASSESTPELLKRVGVLKRGQGIAGRVGDTGEPMIFEDIRNNPTYALLSHSKANQQLSLCSLAVFPIKSKTSCIGTLLCAGRMPRRLAENEIRLITSMAAQIGVAVENTRLYGDLKNKTTLLEKTNVELEEANHTKSKFMAAMSHELRTPLNVINGIVQLMVDRSFGELTEEQERYLRKVVHHGKILLKLINDVLTVTKLETKKMTLDTSTVDLREIINRVKGYTEQLARNGHLEIRWIEQAGLPAIVTDAMKLEEVLQNLIGNAYKFTPQGSIDIGVRDLKEKARVEFVVADTGIGIESASLEQIFEEFHQLKEAHTGSFNGFGLGLNIVKNYLDLMGGDIRVQSQIGIGTTFTFTLPYSLEPSSPVFDTPLRTRFPANQ
jgi:signal transduction histidine kinase